jgi:hypothetical protein
VEAALAERFGRPVPLRLVLDEGQHDAPVGFAAPDEPIDPDELVDARPGEVTSDLDRLTRAFPGAQLIEESSS